MAAQEWYYRQGKRRFGPISSKELKQKAVAGEIGPEDLVRGVGMSEWIPASKIKGLFAAPKPAKTEELGIAPEKPATPAAPVKPVAPKPAPKPAAPKPPANSPVIPPIEDHSNPFAAFGFDQPVAGPPDPFALATGDASGFTTGNAEPDDPFAKAGLTPGAPAPDPFAVAGSGSGGVGMPNLDSLVAFEKSAQAIYREPPPEAEPDPFAAKAGAAKPKSEAIADSFGPAGVIGALVIPFVFMAIMGYIVGAFYSFASMYVSFHLMSAIFALFFSFMITSGLAKMVGLFSGNCLLKCKIKNEITALGYGGLIGIVGIYFCLAGSIWATLNYDPWVMTARDTIRELQRKAEAGEEPVRFLEPDRPSVFSDPDYDPSAAQETDEEIEGEEGDFLADAEDDWSSPPQKPEEDGPSDSHMRIATAFMEGISVPASVMPYYVFWALSLFWFIHGGMLITGIAHSTWAANLGHDPTRS